MVFVNSFINQHELGVKCFTTPVYDVCGVYLLLFNGRVVYAGQSVNVIARLGNHSMRKSNSFMFDSSTIFPCEQESLNAAESWLIEHYKPVYNCVERIGRDYRGISLRCSFEDSLRATGNDFKNMGVEISKPKAARSIKAKPVVKSKGFPQFWCPASKCYITEFIK